jgi:hypothetical protein
LQLAEWFSGSPIAPGEDDVFDKVVKSGKSKHVPLFSGIPRTNSGRIWSPFSLMNFVLKPDDILKFDESLGGKLEWDAIF